jgi:hypothetical protein
MDYHLPIIPTSWETFKEGLGGAATVMALPFILFVIFMRIFPIYGKAGRE